MMLSHPKIVFLLCAITFIGCGKDPGEEDEEPLASTESGLSLIGSQFEIDLNANLVLNDDVFGNLDWQVVDDTKKNDLATGQNDDSYGGGAKEDDLCPTVGTGSIPNNKSDLKTFGVYVEPGSTSSDPGYLHVFWTRVQDPTGTTLMDFEFNQSSAKCSSSGINPVRTVGDFLLEYRLDQGGTVATLKLRTWSAAGVWGPGLDLGTTDAIGSINTTAILNADSDGLGPLSARTFGEASFDLSLVFSSDKCVSFGSAFVKSRASDSFTSALKDFIAPESVNITNCGKVVIRKETDPKGSTESFSFTHNLKTDPPLTDSTFTLTDGQSKMFTDVLLGTGYTVTESMLPTGFDLASIDCSKSLGVTLTTNVTDRKVTFDIDDPHDSVDCTFKNRARGKIVIEKITNDGMGTFDFTSTSTEIGSFSLATTSAGTAGKASKTFDGLNPGTYAVAETEPPGWDLVSAICSDGSAPGAISLSGGETVTCTFVNQRERGAIQIAKTRKHAALGSGPHPHSGVSFVISGGSLSSPITVTTDANGIACADGLVLSSLVGGYTVTEVVPAGYEPDGAASKPVAVTTKASCPSGDPVTFSNTPLTNITVTVDSQVPGGTASKITCTGLAPVLTGADGDGTATLTGVRPGTYTCTIEVDP